MVSFLGRWDAFRPLDKAFSLSFALGFLAEPRHRPLAEKTRQEAVLCFNGKKGHCIDGQTIFWIYTGIYPRILAWIMIAKVRSCNFFHGIFDCSWFFWNFRSGTVEPDQTAWNFAVSHFYNPGDYHRIGPAHSTVWLWLKIKVPKETKKIITFGIVFFRSILGVQEF